MIISKRDRFWEYFIKDLEEIDKETIRLHEAFKGYDETPDINEAIEENFDRREALSEAVTQMYFDSFKDNPAGLYDDIQEIIGALEKEDFLNHIKEIEEDIERIYGAGQKLSEVTSSYFEKARQENWYNARDFIIDIISIPLKGLYYYKLDITPAQIKTEAKASEWYIKDPSNIIEEVTASYLESFSYRHPDSHIQNLTKTNAKIFSQPFKELTSGEAGVNVAPNKRKKGKGKEPVFVTVSVNIDDKLAGIEKLTAFDKSVHNGICSILRSNPNGFFTPKQLATHIYYGDNPNNNNPTAGQVGAVTRSVEKLRHIDISIDYTAHAELNKTLPADIEKLEIKGYIIPAKQLTAKVGGATLIGYKLLDKPPILEYGEFTKQIAEHPANLLSVPVNLSTEEKIALRDYLLEFIGHINKNPEWDRIITIDKILEASGYNVDALSRTQRSRIIETIRSLLEAWKSKGAFKEYTENYTAKTLYSITFTPKD